MKGKEVVHGLGIIFIRYIPLSTCLFFEYEKGAVNSPVLLAVHFLLPVPQSSFSFTHQRKMDFCQFLRLWLIYDDFWQWYLTRCSMSVGDLAVQSQNIHSQKPS